MTRSQVLLIGAGLFLIGISGYGLSVDDRYLAYLCGMMAGAGLILINGAVYRFRAPARTNEIPETSLR